MTTTREQTSPGPAAIGADADAIRNQLCAIADRMEGLLEGTARDLVQDANRVLQAMVCRIAVIGQVKAGKSSLINALIREPRLLPSDVNPWTTAVTRLHFKQSSESSDVAAEFRFFDAHEWEELAVGGGRIRELTERLVPGFEATTLSRHLQAMRDTAANRLGDEFTELLGGSHTFRTFDQTTLEAYVCAGQSSQTAAQNSSVGRYSNITKSAHLYLQGGTFGFPTTLVDTPGTNDPWLVRDEITRQSLDSADVYILVLTARQALSSDDVALLRILRGLRKERIIVFVNRIDELSDFNAELDAVEHQIAQGLRREFAGFDIPIVYGSALWANHAFDGTNIGERLATFEAIQKRLHLAGNHDDVRDVLVTCSGIPLLARILNSAVLQSHPVQVVRHLTTSFAQLSDLHTTATKHAVASLRPSSDKDADSEQARERLTGELVRAREHLQAVSATIEQSVGQCEAALATLLEREISHLKDVLATVVEQFKHFEAQRLVSAITAGTMVPVWRCDTSRLRHKLEVEFSQHFSRSEAAIVEAEQTIIPQLRNVIASVLPGYLPREGADFAPAPMPPPSISALGKVVALDLDAPWWQAWWKRKQIADERANELRSVIADEFAPILADLARSARDQLATQITTTITQTRAQCLGVVEQLHRQNEAQLSRLSDLGASLAITSAPSKSEREYANAQRQHATWAEISSSLDALKRASQNFRRPDVRS